MKVPRGILLERRSLANRVLRLPRVALDHYRQVRRSKFGVVESAEIAVRLALLTVRDPR